MVGFEDVCRVRERGWEGDVGVFMLICGVWSFLEEVGGRGGVVRVCLFRRVLRMSLFRRGLYGYIFFFRCFLRRGKIIVGVFGSWLL